VNMSIAIHIPIVAAKRGAGQSELQKLNIFAFCSCKIKCYILYYVLQDILAKEGSDGNDPHGCEALSAINPGSCTCAQRCADAFWPKGRHAQQVGFISEYRCRVCCRCVWARKMP
jgi:hypothetical protein